jgi:hypothetical protein
MLAMERLHIMARCYRELWDMVKVANAIGLTHEEAVEQYGLEGEFFDEGQFPGDRGKLEDCKDFAGSLRVAHFTRSSSHQSKVREAHGGM